MGNVEILTSRHIYEILSPNFYMILTSEPAQTLVLYSGMYYLQSRLSVEIFVECAPPDQDRR